MTHIGSREIVTYPELGIFIQHGRGMANPLNTGLAIPIASFRESFKHEAVYHPDLGNWTWSYNFTVSLGRLRSGSLPGTLETDSVVWEMRITTGSEFADVLWYYGKSALDKSGGYWILQENPLNPRILSF